MLTPAGTTAGADPAALTRLAADRLGVRDYQAAETYLREAVEQEPHFAPALHLLARTAWLTGAPEQGLGHVRRALDIQPSHPEFRLTCAQFCTWLGRHPEAAALLDGLLAEDWQAPEIRARALGLAGELRIAQGRFAEAQAWLQQSLQLAPGRPATHVVYGMNLLRLGQFEAGWRAYAMREQEPSFHQPDRPPAPGAAWRGEPLGGRTILLVDEQGYGDAIQFFRYLPMLRALRPARIVWQTYAPLRALFADSAPGVDVVSEPPAAPAIDCHATSGSLPGLFGTTLRTIPAPIPYLHPQRRAPIPLAAPPRGSRMRVGLVWSGDARHPIDHWRSVPAGQFLRIARVPRVAFHSLQAAVRDSDLPALADHPGIDRIGERLANYSQTADVVRQLDLVITVDTSVAHLAGALGKPVWLLLPLASDWRWLTGRADTPWYPTARLFRNAGTGWDAVIDTVADALSSVVRGDRPSLLDLSG